MKKSTLHKNYLTSYLFAAPYLIVFAIFVVAPVLVSIFYSFTDFDLLQTPNFVGFDNYVNLFTKDDIFIKSVSNTLLLAVVIGPVSYLLCMMFAWFINELSPKMRAIVTLVFYAPSISGNAYLIWQLMFSGDQYGLINSTLIRLNLIQSPILWLQQPQYAMGIVILVSLWCSLGTSFLTFIAAFQGVDKAYYEAAAIDGIKNRWQELWFVTLPMMRPQMMFSAVMSITGSFGVGAVVTAMLGFPSPDYAAHTMQNHLEDYGGMRFELGYACAIATILFAMMILVNYFIRKLISKVGE